MSQLISESSPSNYSLLTDNASPLEKALEKSFSKLLNEIQPPVPQLRDPLKVPIKALPHLAAEKQVQEWSPDDVEEQKRLTVKNQCQVFQKAGTVSGIQLALEGLGGDVEVLKWHQYGGEPYSMKTRVWISSAPTVEMLSRVGARIIETKSERDSFSLGVGVKSLGKIYTGGAVQIAPRLIIGPWIPPVIQAESSIYNGGAIVAAFKVIAK